MREHVEHRRARCEEAGTRDRFTVPDPPESTYALVLIDDTSDRRSAIPFEIARS